MLASFIEIKNVFDNPEEVATLAKQQTYVERQNHYHGSNNNSYFDGVRCSSLTDIDSKMYFKIMNEIFLKCMQHRLVNDLSKVKFVFGFNASAYFHIMRDKDLYKDEWLHKDEGCIAAGLVYLNPNPEPNTGTILYKDGKDKQPTIIDNEYNKLVLYDNSYWHAPQGGFGSDVNDSRLSLVFFVVNYQMKVEINEEKNEK
jgi:hypothetical protein